MLTAAAEAVEQIRSRLHSRSCVHTIYAKITDFNDAAWYITASVADPRIAVTILLDLWSRWPSEEAARDDLARLLAEVPMEHVEITYSHPIEAGDYGRFRFEAVCLLPDPTRQSRPRNTEPPPQRVIDLVNSLSWKTRKTRDSLVN